ncbi:hypothetical protein QE152_g15801 [Popillia japonica]|uniref:DUF5641 domain-containing protein n=1 Tax=Popillia japonica TaxID=7064 RepID=A0AAW1L8G3_POPJA
MNVGGNYNPLQLKGVRNLAVGERVEARDYIHCDKWELGRVEKKLGKLHYLIKLDDARIWKRHIDQIRSIGENTPISVPKYTSVPVLCDNKATISIENK